VESAAEGSAVSATFTYMSADTMENVMATRSTQLLVMADAKDVDISLFECVNGASLVYDGRIVVDGAFRTNDPNIYAAGTVARFSRELALVHPQPNPTELTAVLQTVRDKHKRVSRYHVSLRPCE
jgi:thioredoxin reductase